MKKLFVALAAVLLVTATLIPAAQALEVEGDAYVGFYDKYLWRGFDLSGGVGVVQGGVDLSANGFTVSYWTNMQAHDDELDKSDPDDDFKSGEATETDIVLDYSFDVSDLVSVSVGNIFYNLEGLADTNEAYVGVSLATLLEPSLTAYYDWDECKEDGLFLTASVGHSVELSDSLSLSLGASVSYNQESDYAVFWTDDNDVEHTYSDWHNYELSAGIDYAVNDNVTVSPSFLYSSPISKGAKLAIDSETVGGVTVAFAF